MTQTQRNERKHTLSHASHMDGGTRVRSQRTHVGEKGERAMYAAKIVYSSLCFAQNETIDRCEEEDDERSRDK